MNLVPSDIKIKKVDNSTIIEFNRRKIGFSDYFIFLFLIGFSAAAIFNLVDPNKIDNFISYVLLIFVVIILINFFTSLKEKQKIIITKDAIEILDNGWIPYRKILDKKTIDRIHLKQVKATDCMLNPFLMLKSYAFNFFGGYFIPQIVYNGDGYSFINYYSNRTKRWLVEYLNQDV
jgi:hypothetical protein